MIDHWIGFLGAAFGLLIGLPQLRRVITTRKVNDIAVWTYIFLVVALACYLFNAIYIGSLTFTLSNAFGLAINGTILILIFRWRKK